MKMIKEGKYDFKECLKFSHSAEDMPFWKEVYKKAFPSMAKMVNHRKNGDHQKFGIDRSIILENSKQILIDEKVRGRNLRTGIVYEDILLEHISNDKNNTPGWVCKPLLCDYIAYAIAPIGKCYLLPVIQLQNAWEINGKKWISNFGNKKTPNKGYSTISTPVPIKQLFIAIGSQLRIYFEKFEC